MDMTETDSPLNLKRAADYLGIAKQTLYHLVSQGKITSYKPSGKLVFFRREDLDAYAFQGRRLANSEVNKKAEEVLNRK